MSNLRFKSVEEAHSRNVLRGISSPLFGRFIAKIPDYFGVNVFDKKKMKKYLSSSIYQKLINAIDNGEKIDRKTADKIADGMRKWATKNNVTHYTHWFHPLNGATAEKHDAFFEIDDGDVIENFSGSLLIQQEPDASSFPNGGIRNTFEARGYTAWDPSSPAFIVDKTLCIPTIFISYTGESLDYKTPLLKSSNALNKAAVDVCKYFSENSEDSEDVSKVFATLGWEQEYFLVDESLYKARPDLILTDRTLMGHSSARDQQLEDHYFGSIPDRVISFMRDFETQCYQLGIPIKTRHNEVAPNQFECAPLFEEVNLAVDHNQLLMDIMRKVAKYHSFVVLFHEKPFKGINGSGKHNNWSMMTDTGVNLLSPSSTSNLQFLTFLICTLKAVYDNSDLLSASIASLGNEHRLGGNEAPPSIISIFLGSYVSKLLEDMESMSTLTPNVKNKLKIDIDKIPDLLLDNTDRNRTSPFAFTGNRFEFRAVGSSANCASPMIALNTAVANQLKQFKIDVNNLLKTGFVIDKSKTEEAIFKVLRRYIKDSKKILFEGNGYSEEWVNIAKERGLSNIKKSNEALKSFISEKTIKLFESNNVLTKRELESRYEIGLDTFIKKLQIESRVLGDLSINHIIPIAIKYQNVLLQNVSSLKEIYTPTEFANLSYNIVENIKTISSHIAQIQDLVANMTKERKVANAMESYIDKSNAYADKVKPFMEDIREHIDDLELIIDDELWPLPKYRELLFTR